MINVKQSSPRTKEDKLNEWKAQDAMQISLSSPSRSSANRSPDPQSINNPSQVYLVHILIN